VSDRELLELAAKAAGYDYECTSHTGYPEDEQHQIRSASGSLIDWNPLTDDGDALRLAVKLGDTFLVKVGIFGQLDKTFCHIDSVATRENLGTDPYAATRRAIVRAAAEITKEDKT
jgi:hypothetical protein